MSWSLNEVEALCRKAAKGAGFTWGEAEEAGRAARWLCRHSQDGAGRLAAYLDRGAEGLLCPIKTGIALADLGAAAQPGPLGEVAMPDLMVPFLADLALITGKPWSLTSATGLAAVAPGGLTILKGTLAPRLSLFKGGHIGPTLTLATRAEVTPEVAAALGRHAHKTYAPATAESRVAGAGAGLSDND